MSYIVISREKVGNAFNVVIDPKTRSIRFFDSPPKDTTLADADSVLAFLESRSVSDPLSITTDTATNILGWDLPKDTR